MYINKNKYSYLKLFLYCYKSNKFVSRRKNIIYAFSKKLTKKKLFHQIFIEHFKSNITQLLCKYKDDELSNLIL